MSVKDLSPAERAELDQRLAGFNELLDTIVGLMRKNIREGEEPEQALANTMMAVSRLQLSNDMAWSLLTVAIKRLGEMKEPS